MRRISESDLPALELVTLGDNAFDNMVHATIGSWFFAFSQIDVNPTGQGTISIQGETAFNNLKDYTVSESRLGDRLMSVDNADQFTDYFDLNSGKLTQAPTEEPSI